MSKFDVVVIGSGPGGYVCAIRCAQLGFKTALVEKYNTLGGTCLNVGCIPSKALLDSSEHFYNAAHTFKDHGINLTNLKVDLDQMIKRKAEVVAQTCGGIDFLMKKNQIEVLRGVGSLKDKKCVISFFAAYVPIFSMPADFLPQAIGTNSLVAVLSDFGPQL